MTKTFTLFKLIAVLFTVLSVQNASAQCNASFSFSAGANGFVFFYSTSTNTTSFTSYSWNFGNTQTGSGSFVSHTYTANGTYTVVLTLGSTSSLVPCSSSATQVITITNVSTCNINASFSHTVGTGGQVSFASTSTGTLSNATFTWNYGDNSSGTGQTSSHTYTANGFYPVLLLVDNGSNCSDSIVQFVNITSFPCTLNAAFNYTLNPNGNVSFASTSTGTTINQSYYNWNLNHQPWIYFGQPAFSNNFTNGTYTITLIVTNSTVNPVCIDSVSQVITVTSNTCNMVPSFTFTQGSNGVFNFVSTSTGTTAFTTYNWDFGDGFTSTGSGIQSHTYTNAGWHTVTLLLQESNSLSCADSVVQQININTVPCVANSNFTLTQLSPGNWQAIPQYPYNVVSATWNWGDNTSTNALYTNHTYSVTGQYTICLTVSVSCGGLSSTCSSYNITRLAEPVSMAFVNVVPPTSVPTGLNENSVLRESDITLFPNPTTGKFTIQLKRIADANSLIEVFSLDGQLIMSETIGATSALNQKTLELTAKEGFYFVKIKTNTGTVTKKIVLLEK